MAYSVQRKKRFSDAARSRYKNMFKLIVPLGLILGSLGIIVFFMIPGWQHFLAVRADSKHLQDIDAEIDTLTQKRDAITDQIGNISKNNFQRLDQILPSGAHGPEFLIALQELALARGVRVGKLDLSGTLTTKSKIPKENANNLVPAGLGGPQGEYEHIKAVMSMSGQYQQFKDFLRDLESYIRITDVERLELDPSDKGFDIRLSVKTYYQ